MTTPPFASHAGFPFAGSEPITPEGTFSHPWYYVLTQMWQKLGGTQSNPQTIVYGVQTGAKQVTFYLSATGESIGYVNLT